MSKKDLKKNIKIKKKRKLKQKIRQINYELKKKTSIKIIRVYKKNTAPNTMKTKKRIFFDNEQPEQNDLLGRGEEELKKAIESGDFEKNLVALLKKHDKLLTTRLKNMYLAVKDFILKKFRFFKGNRQNRRRLNGKNKHDD
jgi:hypothetical protein